jgi:Spy/CpxP family protein refolding chaperone
MHVSRLSQEEAKGRAQEPRAEVADRGFWRFATPGGFSDTARGAIAPTTWRIGVVAALLLGGTASVGCAGSSANAAPAATPTSAVADDATAGLIEHDRYHHHGGVTLFIAMSLDTLGVSPEQRAAVEKIRSDLHARMEPARAAEQNLGGTLADGLAAGTIDAAKVDAAVAQLTAAAATVHEASIDALNELHGVLTPPQRAALVDKVESHWAVWQAANADEVGTPHPSEGRLAMLATDLDLTPDQVDKIRAGLGDTMKGVPPLDPQEVAAHLRAFDDAFLSERFDARLLVTASGVNAHMVGWGAAHMARFVETVAPVLTPDQRTALAQRIHEHATHDPSAQGNL